MRGFGNFLASQILSTPPLSIEYGRYFFTDGIKRRIAAADESVRRLALASSDFFREEDWKNIQLQKLKIILMHAGQHVPYWQKIFRKINFNPEKLERLEELQRIPVMTRADAKKVKPEELVAKSVPRHRFVKAYTSGSTGEPLRFFHDRRDVFYRRSCVYEAIRYAGFSNKARMCVLGLESVRGLDGVGLYISPDDLKVEKLRKENIYPRLSAYRPEVLIATPSYLELFIFFAQQDGFSIKTKAVEYTGEGMPGDLLRRIEGFFSAEVFSAYGTKEISPLGIHCSHKSLHLVPWLNMVEILDVNNAVLRAGEEGRVVVTSFENYAMPFIRYDVGDTGAVSANTCACGRKISAIALTGREPHTIEFRNGTKIIVNRALNVEVARRFHKAIARFQLEERGDEFIFRVVPTAYYSESTKEELRAYFRELFGSETRCVLEETPYITPNKEGKTSIFLRSSDKFSQQDKN